MSAPATKSRPDDGFALVALIVAIFLILLALSVAAPKVAMELKHEREIETAHRANQYVRAIREYYIQNGNQYPASIEQLEKTNNHRFLRQRYKDPATGEANWRLILVGQNKTTVKGFFGQDLPGIAPGMGGAAGLGGGANLGSAAGSASGLGGLGSSSPGGTSGLGLGSSSSPTNSSSTGTTAATGTDSSGATGSTSPSGSGSGLSGSGLPSQSATDAKGIGGPFMGVGTARSGSAMLTVNQQTHYQDWEFLYDPRVELLKAQVSIFGGGGPPTGGSSNSIGGSTPGTAPGSGGFGSSTSGSGGFGGSSLGGSSNGFGSSSSGFGSSSGSGTSNTGTGSTGTTGTTPP